MEDQEAIECLVTLLAKYELTEEEKDAVKTAIGVLSWTKLRKAVIRNWANTKHKK